MQSSKIIHLVTASVTLPGSGYKAIRITAFRPIIEVLRSMQSGKIIHLVTGSGTDQSRITEPDHWHPLPDHFITDHRQNPFSEALRSMQSSKIIHLVTGSGTLPGSGLQAIRITAFRPIIEALRSMQSSKIIHLVTASVTLPGSGYKLSG